MKNHTFLRMENDGYLAYCEVCGRAHLLKTPMPMNEFSRQLKAFDKEHKNCKPQQIDCVILDK